MRRDFVAGAHPSRWLVASAISLVLLLPASALFAQQMVRYWDPTPGAVPALVTAPDRLVASSEALFFLANGTGNRRVLWASDGTLGGTAVIRDPLGDFISSATNHLTASGSRLFFSLNTSGYGRELWTSNGTALGTRLVADVCPGPCGDIEEIAALDGERVIFAQGVDFTLPAVWGSDGTEDGTGPLVPLLPGGDGIVPMDLVSTGDRVFFRAIEGALDPDAPTRLFVTDGTPDGTVALTGSAVEVLSVAQAGEGVIFLALDPLSGLGWWSSDGTVSGTQPLLPVAGRGLDHPPWTIRASLTTGQGVLLSVFEPVAGDPVGSGRCTLWRSDGSVSGTRRLVDLSALDPSVGASPGICPDQLVAISDLFLFTFVGETFGRELWVSDGTELGTHVLDRHPGPAGSDIFALQGFRGGAYFFEPVGANSQVARPLALWRSDGSLGGTAPLMTFDSTRRADFGEAITVFKDRLYFAAASSIGKTALWTSDGTAAGTHGLVKLGPEVPPVVPLVTARAPSALYFLEHDDPAARSLWRTDGTAAGTTAVYVPPPSTAELPWSQVVAAGDRVFFRRFDEAGDLRLWVSDGTGADTRMLPVPVAPLDLAAVGPGVCFSGWTPELGVEPWCSDGTPEGTVLLRDIAPGQVTEPEPGPASSMPGGWVQVGSHVVFQATRPDIGRELWETDGTPSGTRLIGDLRAGPSDTLARGLTAVSDDHAFFVARGPLDGRGGGLWIWDIIRRSPRAFRARPRSPIALAESDGVAGVSFRGRYYVLVHGPTASFLWSSEGSAESTRQLVRIETIPGPPLDPELTVVGNDLFFVLRSERIGGELWATDGTAQGTRRVTEIAPGLESSNPHDLVALGSLLFFVATDRTHGTEPWTSDGTLEGTRLGADLNYGPAGSDLQILQVLETGEDPRGVFSAWSPDRGFGLWVFEPEGFQSRTCVAREDRFCLGGGRFEVLLDWRDPRTGARGRAPGATASDLVGEPWFFRPDNVEVAVKILDGSQVNGHAWLLYGALTSLPFDVSVADLKTGATRTYLHEFMSPCGGADVRAFELAPGDSFPKVAETFAETTGATIETVPCADDPTALCWFDGRFRATVAWHDQRRPGRKGIGTPVPRAGRTGAFWFFRPDNLELYVKVLDGRQVNGHFWVFHGPMTDVAFDLTVTDTTSGVTRVYQSTPGTLCGGADTSAF